MLADKNVFVTQNNKGLFIYEMFRTPGYPFSLAILNVFLRIPLDGIIFI